MDLLDSKGRNASASIDPAPPSSPDMSDDEVDLHTPNEDGTKTDATKEQDKTSEANTSAKGEKTDKNGDDEKKEDNTKKTGAKLGRMDSLKSKWSEWSAQSNEYLSKKKESIAKSVKENASKIKTNLDHNLRRRISLGQNGVSDNKLTLPEL
ncbi:putative lipoprotein [Reticulomyxa filosa]|uniref:Putative lipoprotein n=1 Tax=Reticulomyxa filosa TaxID=46433 RepID=X6PDR9_RETFI|nr:putative lipoprotein [Reticulomyxa filosa]|eukprot:ETO36650.1 putative lipoprotein [Reticulomyxa filosa]